MPNWYQPDNVWAPEIHLSDLGGLPPDEQALRGDLDGDGDNDFTVFRLFQTDFDQVNGEDAFDALFRSAVPEPGGIMFLAACAMAYAIVRRFQ